MHRARSPYSQSIEPARRSLTRGVAIAAIWAGAYAFLSGQTPPSSKSGAATVTVVVVPVRSQMLERRQTLPGELVAFEDVAIHPRVQGFVESIAVDRGSKVKRGQELVKLVAPEFAAQRA